MENQPNETAPSANASSTPDVSFRPSRFNAAQEYPGLRRFHFILVIVTVIKLLFVTWVYSTKEAATENFVWRTDKVSKDSGVRSTAKQRAQWEAEFTSTFNQTLVIELADALIMLACACLVFHYPFASTGLASLLYLISGVGIVLVHALSPELPPIGWLAIGTRIGLLLLLLKAFHVAWQFEDEFAYRESERKRLATTS